MSDYCVSRSRLENPERRLGHWTMNHSTIAPTLSVIFERVVNILVLISLLVEENGEDGGGVLMGILFLSDVGSSTSEVWVV